MRTLKLLVSGALAAVIAGPALAQSPYHSTSLRFDQRRPVVDAGEDLHFHVDLLRARGHRTSVTRLSAAHLRVWVEGHGARVRSEGDGFRFRASQAGRFTVHALYRSRRGQLIGDSMTVRVRDVRKVSRIELRTLSGRPLSPHHIETLRPGQVIDLQALAFDQRGRQMSAKVNFSLSSRAAGRLVRLSCGPNRMRLIAGAACHRTLHALTVASDCGCVTQVHRFRIRPEVIVRPQPRPVVVQPRPRPSWGFTWGDGGFRFHIR